MKNHLATHLRLAAAATLGAALLSSTGMAQEAVFTNLDADIERLKAAIAPIVLAQDPDSQPIEAASLATTSPEYIAALVQELLASNIPDRVSLLGKAAAPELVRLARELDLVQLVAPQSSNPLVQLSLHLPEATLEFLMDLQVSSPIKFEALIREGYKPMSFVRSAALDETLKARLAGFVTAIAENDQLPLSARVREAVQAYQLGVDSTSGVSLIRKHPAEARKEEVGDVRRLFELLYPKGAPLPTDIPFQLAADVTSARPSRALLGEVAAMPSAKLRRLALDYTSYLVNGSETRDVDGALDVVVGLLDDEDSLIVERAVGYLYDLMRERTPQLSATQILRISEEVNGRSWEDSRRVTRFPNNTILALDELEGVPDETLERIFRAGLTAKEEAVRIQWQSDRIRIKDLRQSLAYARAALALSPEDTERALYLAKEVILQTPRSSPEYAAAVLGFLTVGEPDPEGVKKRVEALTAYRGGRTPEAPKSPELLNALQGDDRMRALRLLTSQDGEFAGIVGGAIGKWTGMEGPLRGLIADGDEPRRIRLFGYLALVLREECTPEELSTFSDWLIELAQSPEGREDVLWTWRARAYSYGSGPVSHRQWAKVTADMLEHASVPDEIAVEAPLPLRPSTDPADLALVRQVLDAAEARQGRSAEVLGFPSISSSASKWMEERGELVRPKLLNGWIEHRHVLPTAMRIAAVSTFPELRKIAEDYYLDRIANIPQGGVEWRRKELESTVDMIFRMPGSEPVARLLDYTLKSDNSELATYVEERITNKLRLTEAVARWSTLAAGGETVESARAKVIAMLDSKDGETRVQAIYALGTLGAIEAIPRLLGFVSSDSGAEKAAALEALETLRKSAAKDQ